MAEASTWQPVGTAPRDGSPILSWDGDTYAVVVWCGCKGLWALVECPQNKPHGEPVKWSGITHWAPLPAPPGELEEEG